ncbi:MAG: preprotein translocase subunit SecE [Chloroflexota bacterium]|nr:preprotein translocase subunit SecE [Chloroflexota bacterium]
MPEASDTSGDAMRLPWSTTDRARAARQHSRSRREAPTSRLPRFLQQPVAFLQEAYGELRKAHWPTRETALNLTLVVIAVSLVVGMFLSGVDYVFAKLFALLVE